MILTGKCLEAFNKELGAYKENFNDLPIACRNALIIEFFDSVGIYIHKKRNCTGIKFNHWYFIITDENGVHLNNFLECKIIKNSRPEATTEAIKKANEIFNNR